MERIPLDSISYDTQDYDSISYGLAPIFFSRPYSKNIIEDSADDSFFLTPILGYSLRFQYLNRDVDDKELSYWYNRWIENSPLINLGFKTGNKNFILFTEYDIRYDFFRGFNSDQYSNIPFRSNWYQDFDFNFPVRSYIAFGNRDLQLFLGRDKLKFGPGQKGSLMISPESTFFNQLALSYENPHFKATIFFISLESYLTDDEKNELETFINSGSDLVPTGNFGKDISDQSKSLTGHRFELRPLDNLTISFTDMLVLGGRFPNFEDIPPTMFYHNVYGENYSNVMIGFDFFWVPVQDLGIYGEFIIDDIRNSYEESFSVPTSLGYLGGIRYNLPWLPGRLTLSVEGALIDQFTYRRWHPYTDFFTRRKFLSTSIMENRYLDSPIGFFLGPDSMFLSIWIAYIMDRYNLETGWEFRRKGVIPDLSPEDFITSYSLSENTDYNITNSLYFKGKYNFDSNFSFSVSESLYITSEILYILSLSFEYKL